MASQRATENLAYHASRLLLLISLCGKPRKPTSKSEKLPGIEGRTLLAKLDFFIRYPVYLKRAAKLLHTEISDEDLGLATDEEMHSVESHMVRYLYGPWDHIYYSALAYLIGKGLIVVEKNDRKDTDIFRLTTTGQNVADNIFKDPAYTDLVLRANSTYRLFNRYTGNRMKDFIYKNFPEVVSRKIGTTI